MSDEIGRRILDGEMPPDDVQLDPKEAEAARRILDGEMPIDNDEEAKEIDPKAAEAARRILDGEAPEVIICLASRTFSICLG